MSSSAAEYSSPRKNQYSCENCRTSHKRCTRSNAGQDCDLCVKKGLSDCGLSTDSHGRTQPCPPVAGVSTNECDNGFVHDVLHDAAIRTPASTRRGLFNNSGIAPVDILTGFVVFEVLLVRTMEFLQPLLTIPRFHLQGTRIEQFVSTIISWLNDNFLNMMNDLSDEERRLLEALQTPQTICAIRLANVSQSQGRQKSRTEPQRSPRKIRGPWKAFCQTYPVSKTMLTCVVNILKEFDSGVTNYELCPSHWTHEQCRPSYVQLSRIINMIHQVYSVNCPGPPVTVFPYWQIAYRNGQRDFALRQWLQLPSISKDTDLFGIGLSHLSVEAEDVAMLERMVAHDSSVGQFPQSGYFKLSPLLYAAATDSAPCYRQMTRHEQADTERESLELAAVTGSLTVVDLLTKGELSIPGPYSNVASHAIGAKQERVGCLLEALMRENWFDNEDLPRLSRLAEIKGFTNLRDAFQTMQQSEPQARDALDDLGMY